MKTQNFKFMNKLNKELKDNNQNIKINYYTGKKIILSNGLIISNFNEMNTFKKRIRNKNYVKYIDIIYGLDKELSDNKLKELVSDLARKGGFACWEKHKNNWFNNKGHVAWNKGTHGLMPEPWNKGLTKYTDERLKKNSDNMIGEKNYMYGKVYPEEIKRKQSKIVKEKIKNGEWTPHIHNSNTHWDITWNNKKYRSSWEAMFHQLNPKTKYEKLRISYQFNDNKHIYITDFIDEENKIVYEIKPKCHKNTLKWQSKEKAILKWSEENNYNFYFIDEWYFYNNWNKIKLNELDEKSQINAEKLYETCKKKRNKKTKCSL